MRASDEALDALERTAEAKLAEMEDEDAKAIEQRLTSLREIRQEGPHDDPIMKAVLGFLQAESDEEARQLLANQGQLLLTLDGRNIIEGFLEAARQRQDDELRVRFEARLALWNEVRLGQQSVSQPSSMQPSPTSGRRGFLHAVSPISSVQRR